MSNLCFNPTFLWKNQSYVQCCVAVPAHSALLLLQLPGGFGQPYLCCKYIMISSFQKISKPQNVKLIYSTIIDKAYYEYLRISQNIFGSACP